MIDRIDTVYIENEIELIWPILDQVRFMTKTKQGNNVIDSIGVVYVEIEIELSGLI